MKESIGHVFKWLSLSFAFSACALAVHAGSLLGGLSALTAGVLGFVAVEIVSMESHHD
ncbi:MAG: hypothetical protein FWG15_02860 [Propionibacteriaceae bacterium]|nr:hypothetical protein [Propionibacteriaceae bacterium]